MRVGLLQITDNSTGYSAPYNNNNDNNNSNETEPHITGPFVMGIHQWLVDSLHNGQ